MRITITATFLLASLISGNAIAFESGVTPHAMFYVNVPLGGASNSKEQVRLGFRIDSIEYSEDQFVQYGRLINQHALLDFRINQHGLQSIYISGTDYLQLYRVSRQNQDQGGEGQGQADDTNGKSFADALAELPLGFHIGVGLGVGLLLGVGD